MATVAQYEDAHAEVVFAFAKALRIQRDLSVSDVDYENEALLAAFEVAKRHGWDWEMDGDFTDWCLKATRQEICVEGLRRALGGVRL